MRLLYVCADRGVPLLGHKGASAHVRHITGALAARGHDVTVACAKIGTGNPPPSGVEVWELPDVAAAQLTDLIARCRSAGYSAVIERYSLNGRAASRASQTVGVPFVIEVNAPLVLEAARYRGFTDVAGGLEHERQILGSAHAIMVVSAVLAGYVRGVAPQATVYTVPNGVDPAKFARPAHPLRPVVGFVGSMKAWHGVQDLLTAFAQIRHAHPDARLMMVGDGPELEPLSRRLADEGLSDVVTLLGPVAHAAVPSILAGFAVAVAPYAAAADFYFSPLKVVEYLAAGVPVVHPDLGDLAETVGPAGICYPPGDVAALACAIDAMLDDEGLRRRCADHARTRVLDRTWDAVAARVEQVVLGVVDRQRGLVQ